MSIVGALYACAARARRRAWQQPGRQHRLRRPVVSVGNLRVGGMGKTPVAAYVATLLVDMGERPAILSRGYGRKSHQDGVVVVSDGSRVLADLDHAGDEPLMLARALRGVPVLVSPDRYLAGQLAETRLGATVHVLDDGFQHLSLARDVDLLILSREDAADGRTLPWGRLREGLDAASQADALLVPDADAVEAHGLAARLGLSEGFGLARSVRAPRVVVAAGVTTWLEPGTRVLAVAGIARPERFFADVAASGLVLVGTSAYRDHHRYTARDVRLLADEARRAGADAVLTTEKDLMRLLPFQPFPVTLAWLPLEVAVEPAVAFREWLRQRLSRGAGEPAEGPGTGSDGCA
jgi:tetraacyldisaccharide 4'-kinase